MERRLVSEHSPGGVDDGFFVSSDDAPEVCPFVVGVVDGGGGAADFLEDGRR